MLKTIARKLLSSFIVNDRGGNFAMMTALLLPLTIGGAGIALDLASAMQTKNNLQNVTDAAALAAAAAMSGNNMSDEQGLAFANTYVVSHMMQQLSDKDASPEEADAMKKALVEGSTIKVKKIISDLGEVSYSVAITSQYEMKLSPMTGLLGMKTMQLSASSTAEASTESKNALSMYLVLDRSGSMAWDTKTLDPTRNYCEYYLEDMVERYKSPCYIKKMPTLKIAVKSLVETLDKADPGKKFVRMGAVSYNSSMQTPTALAWGTATSLKYVNALPADGGTNSGDAMQKAYDSLMLKSNNVLVEESEHLKKNGKKPTKFIVLMTDGANSKSSYDTKTMQVCDAARKNSVQVYTVAFMAPKAGQTLLKYCATTEGNYYEAENTSELVLAFKRIGEHASQTATRLTN